MSVRSEGGARSGERTASHRWALWILTQGMKGADGEWRKAGTAIRPSALTTTTSAGPQRYARRAPLKLAIKIVSPINGTYMAPRTRPPPVPASTHQFPPTCPRICVPTTSQNMGPARILKDEYTTCSFKYFSIFLFSNYVGRRSSKLSA